MPFNPTADVITKWLETGDLCAMVFYKRPNGAAGCRAGLVTLTERWVYLRCSKWIEDAKTSWGSEKLPSALDPNNKDWTCGSSCTTVIPREWLQDFFLLNPVVWKEWLEK